MSGPEFVQNSCICEFHEIHQMNFPSPSGSRQRDNITLNELNEFFQLGGKLDMH
jgi:hypothetical protein